MKDRPAAPIRDAREPRLSPRQCIAAWAITLALVVMTVALPSSRPSSTDGAIPFQQSALSR